MWCLVGQKISFSSNCRKQTQLSVAVDVNDWSGAFADSFPGLALRVSSASCNHVVILRG
jgi:hypothetical protein